MDRSIAVFNAYGSEIEMIININKLLENEEMNKDIIKGIYDMFDRWHSSNISAENLDPQQRRRIIIDQLANVMIELKKLLKCMEL